MLYYRFAVSGKSGVLVSRKSLILQDLQCLGLRNTDFRWLDDVIYNLKHNNVKSSGPNLCQSASDTDWSSTLAWFPSEANGHKVHTPSSWWRVEIWTLTQGPRPRAPWVGSSVAGILDEVTHNHTHILPVAIFIFPLSFRGAGETIWCCRSSNHKAIWDTLWMECLKSFVLNCI